MLAPPPPFLFVCFTEWQITSYFVTPHKFFSGDLFVDLKKTILQQNLKSLMIWVVIFCGSVER